MSVYTIQQDIAQNILRRGIHIHDLAWLYASVEKCTGTYDPVRTGAFFDTSRRSMYWPYVRVVRIGLKTVWRLIFDDHIS